MWEVCDSVFEYRFVHVEDDRSEKVIQNYPGLSGMLSVCGSK